MQPPLVSISSSLISQCYVCALSPMCDFDIIHFGIIKVHEVQGIRAPSFRSLSLLFTWRDNYETSLKNYRSSFRYRGFITAHHRYLCTAVRLQRVASNRASLATGRPINRRINIELTKYNIQRESKALCYDQ